MSRAVQEGCIASCVRYFLLPDHTHTGRIIRPPLHQTYTACSWLVRHSRGGLCKLYPPTPPLRRTGHPVFWGSQPCVPAAWLAERLLLAGYIESNPRPKPTLKTLSPTRTQPLHSPSTLAHQSNALKPAHPHSP